MRLWSLLLLLPITVFAYTSPGKPTGFVNDFAKLLTQEEVLSLESSLKSFKETSGNEIALVTIDNLGGDTIENFAGKLFEEWQIGDKKLDNGLLILVSEEDRQMRIEVGYGLEPYITDIESSYIISNILAPNFREGKFFQGLNDAVVSIESALIEELNIEDRGYSTDVSFGLSGDFLYYFALGFVMLASVLGRTKDWWAGGAVGGFVGVVIGFIKGFVFVGLISIILLVPVGLLFDYLVSKSHAKHKLLGTTPWWVGRGRGGGGFGGFGGGSSGGGGASGRW